MSVILTTRGLVAGYDGAGVTSVPDLTVARGERVTIRGANGSGKTTLLKTLARLLPPVAGTVDGPAAGRGGAVYVHPSPHLFAGSGFDNVLLGAHGNRVTARAALAALGAEAFGGVDVRALSNGQRQRIALARALAAEPSLLLLDEADTGLDRDGLARWHAELARRTELAVVIASPLSEGGRQKAEGRSVVLVSAPG